MNGAFAKAYPNKKYYDCVEVLFKRMETPAQFIDIGNEAIPVASNEYLNSFVIQRNFKSPFMKEAQDTYVPISDCCAHKNLESCNF